MTDADVYWCDNVECDFTEKFGELEIVKEAPPTPPPRRSRKK